MPLSEPPYPCRYSNVINMNECILSRGVSWQKPFQKHWEGGGKEGIRSNSPGCICPIPQMTISLSQEHHRLEALADYTSLSLLLCKISFLSKETKDLPVLDQATDIAAAAASKLWHLRNTAALPPLAVLAKSLPGELHTHSEIASRLPQKFIRCSVAGSLTSLLILSSYRPTNGQHYLVLLKTQPERLSQ